MARVGPEGYAERLRARHAREMDFTGKALKGFIDVAGAGIEPDADLMAWVERSLESVRRLPPK